MFGPVGPFPQFLRDQGKFGGPQPVHMLAMIIRISRLAVAWMIRPWNFSHGRAQLGLRRIKLAPEAHIALYQAWQ